MIDPNPDNDFTKCRPRQPPRITVTLEDRLNDMHDSRDRWRTWSLMQLTAALVYGVLKMFPW